MYCWKRNVLGAAVVALGLVMICAGTASANVLANPGFETDAVFGAAPVAGATGWVTSGGNAFTASDPNDPVRTGIGSLQLVGAGGFGVPTARQEFPVNPGQIVNLQGYHLTETALPADATFHLFKIVWENALGFEIDPIASNLDPAFIGNGTLLGANPGVESGPFLNSLSAVNVWNFSEAQGTAPPTAASVVLLGGLLVDQSAATVYVDDVVGTIVPEPTSAALALVSLLGLGLRRKR